MRLRLNINPVPAGAPALGLALLLSAPSPAQQPAREVSSGQERDPEAAARERQEVELSELTVVGRPEAARFLPGSGQRVEGEEIRKYAYDDLSRVLRRVPGVYLREEDGFGLFPNVSIRGTDPGRSGKVTLMEDGVLMAPAPYSAPGAYNAPSVGRMSAVEVLKGTSQVRYGPHVTGGVLNYLSTPIPMEPTARVRTLYGSWNDLRAHASAGDRVRTDSAGTFGWLVEGWFRTNEGFKRIDTTGDFVRGDRTGFRTAEPMVKLSWEPEAATYHRFEVKAGRTDRVAHETYLGLSEEDFRRNAVRRYAASRFDRIDMEHDRAHLRHAVRLRTELDLTTTVYWNNFRRNWFKLQDLRDIDVTGNGIGDGVNSSLSRALAGGDAGAGLEVLRGERAGTLRYRANNRSYSSAGAESVARWRIEGEGTGWDHEVTFGARFHSDRERRLQHHEEFVQDSAGRIVDRAVGAPGSQDHRVGETDAWAFFVQDRIEMGRLALVPGVRFEHLQQAFRDFRTAESDRGSLNLVGGGLGATYDVDEAWQVFGGLHRGFSPPAPRARLRDDLQAETSLAAELGARHAPPGKAYSLEATAFFTRFQDLIVTDIAGAGGVVGDPENVGEVRAYGLELLAEYDPGRDLEWRFRNPWFAAATFTRAELASDTPSANPESLFAGGRKGNRVPYIPYFTVTLGTGIETDAFGLFLTGIFVDEAFTSASNTRDQVDASGNPDARFGTTDRHFLADLSAHARLAPNARLVAGVHNLFDETYVAGRHPHGPRPGAPRFLFAGVEVDL